MVRSIGIFAVICLTMLSVPASAQWTMSVPPPLDTSSVFMRTIGAASSTMEKLDRERDEQERNGKNGTSEAANSDIFKQFTYKLSPAQRTANLARFKSAVLKPGIDEKSKKFFEQLYSETMFMAADKSFQALGLNSLNIADVYAVYIAKNWQASNGIAPANFPDTFIPPLAEQMRMMLSINQKLETLNDEQKQLAAEGMIGDILLVSAVNDLGKDDPAMKQLAQDYGRSRLKDYGFDYTKFEINETGFVLRQ
jgi:hypothetical protein